MFKKKAAGLCALAILMGAVPTMAGPHEVPVIQLDRDGNPEQVKIDGKDYTARLKGVMQTFHDSALPALSSTEANNNWMLRVVLVGVGVNTSFGLGPIFSIGAAPRVRLLFTNSTDPVLP